MPGSHHWTHCWVTSATMTNIFSLNTNILLGEINADVDTRYNFGDGHMCGADGAGAKVNLNATKAEFAGECVCAIIAVITALEEKK